MNEVLHLPVNDQLHLHFPMRISITSVPYRPPFAIFVLVVAAFLIENLGIVLLDSQAENNFQHIYRMTLKPRLVSATPNQSSQPRVNK
jgi:hypothetical protein